MAGSDSGRYRVSCAEAQLAQLRLLSERANQLGLLKQFIDAVLLINHKLESEPLAWGDPHNMLEDLDLAPFHRIHWMMQVFYALNEASRTVFIREFRALPGSQLATTS